MSVGQKDRFQVPGQEEQGLGAGGVIEGLAD